MKVTHTQTINKDLNNSKLHGIHRNGTNKTAERVFIEDFKSSLREELFRKYRVQTVTTSFVDWKKNPFSGLGRVAHSFHPGTQEAEAGESVSSRPAWSTE